MFHLAFACTILFVMEPGQSSCEQAEGLSLRERKMKTRATMSWTGGFLTVPVGLSTRVTALFSIDS